MENVCVILDFEEVSTGKNFKKIQLPDSLNQYSLYSGGNCYYFTNNKMTVRFHEFKLGSEVPETIIEGWMKKLKNMYPKF